MCEGCECVRVVSDSLGLSCVERGGMGTSEARRGVILGGRGGPWLIDDPGCRGGGTTEEQPYTL